MSLVSTLVLGGARLADKREPIAEEIRFCRAAGRAIRP